jgi:hypothetical protein
MRLVLAHTGDDEAARIARELDAQLVTPRALSERGWSHYPVGGGRDSLPIGGEVVEASAIRGVVMRISGVVPADLPHIDEGDRTYVAAEMTAFLLSFVIALECPVINRPTATSLMGPGFTTVRWRAAARAAGFVADAPEDETHLAVVVGARCLGAPDATTEQAAIALARIAGMELLGVRVAPGLRFAGARPWCHLPPDALAALRERLGEAA